MKLIFGLFLILLGLSALTGLGFLLRFFIALVFIVLGIRILTGKREFFEQTTEFEADSLNEVYVFTGVNKKITSTDFSGGKVTLVFAGGQMDLRGVKTKTKDISLEIVVVFGGGKLLVSKNWKVNTEGLTMLGGVDNKTAPAKEPTVTLNLKGSVILGGLEIVN